MKKHVSQVMEAWTEVDEAATFISRAFAVT